MYVLYSELYCGILSSYCLLLLLQRSLSVPLLEPLLLLIDGHHLLFGLLRLTAYCTVMLMGVPHMTVLTEQLKYCLTELFSYCKDIHS